MNKQYNMEKELLQPYTHLLQVKGKQFRNKIVIAFNHWLKVPEDQLQSSLEIATMVHNASLLLDDIQDGSVVRRGMPAAHCIYGVPLTINAAVQVLAMAMQKSLQLVPNEMAMNIYAQQFFGAVYGQGVDVYWRDNLICPTETEYRQMVQQKTGRMIMFGVKLVQLFSQDKKDYEDFVMLLGLYFQMRDDYCNLKQQEAACDWTIMMDTYEKQYRIPEDIVVSSSRPDIFLYSRRLKRVILVELTVPWETNIPKDHTFKALEEWPGAEDVHAKNNNNFCEDITEGKFSLPIIHAMKTPEGPQVLSILRKRTRDVELKKYCVFLLEKSGSLQYTRDALSECDRNARAELARLGGNPLMEAVLDGLLTWKDGK